MFLSYQRGVDSVGAWDHRRLLSKRVTIMWHLAGTTRQVVSCEHREHPVVSVGAVAVPVPGKSSATQQAGQGIY